MAGGLINIGGALVPEDVARSLGLAPAEDPLAPPPIPEGAASAFGQGALAPPVVSAADVAASQGGGGLDPTTMRTFQPETPEGVDAITGAGEVAPPARRPADTVVTPPPAAAGPSADAPAPQGGQGAQRTTSADLLQTGYGDVLDAQVAALSKQEEAANATAEAEAAKQRELAKVYVQRNEEAAKLQAEREAALEADRKQLAKTEQEFAAATKAFADKKIDRNRRFQEMGTGRKVLLGLSVALSGLGQALKGRGGEPIPALQYIDEAIREDVDLQFREKEGLAQAAQMKRGQLDVAMQTANHRQAQYQLAMAGHIEKAAREVEAIAAKAESELVKTRAGEFAAQLREKGATYLGQAVQLQHSEWQTEQERAQRERDSKRQAGVAYARIKEDRRQFDLSHEARLAELAAKKAEAEREAMAAGNTALAKEIRELGVPDLKQADGSMYKARSDKAATEVASTKAATDSVVAFTDELIRLKKKYGSEAAFLKSAEWQKMRVNVASIQNSLRVAEQMGTLDKGSMEQLQAMMGGDVMRDGAFDVLVGNMYKGGAEEGLRQLRKNTLLKFNERAKALRDPLSGDYVDYEPPDLGDVPTAKETRADAIVKDVLAQQTPEEIKADAKPGVGRRFIYALADETPEETEARRRTEAETDTRLPGVTKTQAENLYSLGTMAYAEGAEDDGEREASKRALIELAKQGGARGDAALQVIAEIGGDTAAIDEVAEARAAAARGTSKPGRVTQNVAGIAEDVAKTRTKQVAAKGSKRAAEAKAEREGAALPFDQRDPLARKRLEDDFRAKKPGAADQLLDLVRDGAKPGASKAAKERAVWAAGVMRGR